jgi:uncharacterized membrane protein
MSLDLWLHFFHVLAASVWVGAGVTLSLIGFRRRSGADRAALNEFARLLPFVGLRVLMPAVVVVLITGVWMVLAGSEFRLTQPWVLLALGLFAIAFLIGAVYLSRIGIALDRASSPAATATADLPGLLDRWLVGYGAVLLVLLVAVWDMVFKPGL